MGIDELRQDAIAMTRWEQHKFFVLIAGVILLSTFNVLIPTMLKINFVDLESKYTNGFKRK